MRSPWLHMFAGALMAAHSQQAWATRTHSRMRGGTAGPAARRRPDSFPSAYGPIYSAHGCCSSSREGSSSGTISLLQTDSKIKNKILQQCGFQMLRDGRQDGSSFSARRHLFGIFFFFSSLCAVHGSWWWLVQPTTGSDNNVLASISWRSHIILSHI